ncbi:hypothetical protein AAHA92_09869 [Salvia divinorum]|uniref:Uncharacterized protein n=1 Tax=Salvia divinorum TaxID=28513 RepID=A0ABD1HU81_SALDI
MARTSSHVSDKTELELSSPFAQRLFRPTPDTARQPRRRSSAIRRDRKIYVETGQKSLLMDFAGTSPVSSLTPEHRRCCRTETPGRG